MLRYLLLTLSFLICCLCLSPLYGQEEFTRSGETKLIVRFDSVIGDSDAPELLVGSSLMDIKPVGFTLSGNQYEANIHTFGPVAGNLRLLGNIYLLLLLPGETAIININNGNSGNDVKFEGHFKEVFDDSDAIWTFTGEILNSTPHFQLFTSANDYREHRVQHLDSVLTSLLKDSDLEGFSKWYAIANIDFIQKVGLIDYNVHANNLNFGLDSMESTKHIPKRGLDYYHTLIGPELNDTSSLLIAPYYVLMSTLLKDTLMTLPDLKVDHPAAFRNALRGYLTDYLGEDDGLFYDMVTATAYIQQLERLEPLTDLQKHHIEEYFKNSDLSDYIFRENDYVLKAIANNQNLGEGAVYLKGTERGDLWMEKLIQSKRNKVTIVDFWATWCGPCIEAFRSSAHIKKKYADNNDVRFIYITDESSEPKLWNDYVEWVAGEHYYIYREQMHQIYDTFDFSVLPTYLIYDENGALIKKASGHLDNDELMEIIEVNLK